MQIGRIKIFGLSTNTSAESHKYQAGYVTAAVVSFLFAAVVKDLFPGVIPFGLFQFWHTTGTVGDWLGTAWPVLAWGAGLTALASLVTRNTREQNRNAERFLEAGWFVSLRAGVLEEASFRWAIFMAKIVGLTVVNWLIFGFLGFGVPEWLQIHIFGPVANFLTLGLLHDQLANPANWVVGAAMLSANALFRDGHKYEGLFGWVNSWFIGMFFFYLMFTYGLIASILVHFLYDALIFTVQYVDRVIERAEGN